MSSLKFGTGGSFSNVGRLESHRPMPEIGGELQRWIESVPFKLKVCGKVFLVWLINTEEKGINCHM